MNTERSNYRPPQKPGHNIEHEQQKAVTQQEARIETKPLTEITLEICPKCGEPTLGSHNCNELTELINQYGPESVVAKSLGPILAEAKAKWSRDGKGGNMRVEIKSLLVDQMSGTERVDLAQSEEGAIAFDELR